MGEFRDRVVWITGASSGIGEALAYELAGRGARLVLSARRTELLESVRERCARPHEHLVVAFDITDFEALPRHVKHVLSELGQVDMLINNAGVSQRSLARETSLDVDRRIFETDYFGPIALAKALLPSMLARGAGHLVAVSSLAGLVATPYRSSYSAAKAAILAFHDSLRAENHEAGIKVSVVCPGFVTSNVANAAFTGDGSAAAGRFPQSDAAMSAAEFARRTANALAREQRLIVVAGREALIWWINRLSPSLAAQIIRRVKVT